MSIPVLLVPWHCDSDIEIAGLRPNFGFFLQYSDLKPVSWLGPTRRDKFLLTIDKNIQHGRHAISEVLNTQNSYQLRQRYVQTLDLLDRVIRGWGNSFAYSNAKSTIEDLDAKIEERLKRLQTWYHRRTENTDWRTKRRAVGVGLLVDIEPKRLDQLPFRLEKGKRHRKTKEMIIISTDGSVIGAGPRAGRDKGPGGWSAVFHNDGTKICGHADQVTNNQMELTAVIETLKRTPIGSRVRIRTDSQYVCRAVQEGRVIRSNADLWNIFRDLNNQRRVDLVWVPGHSGDEYNERADILARDQANLARIESQKR